MYTSESNNGFLSYFGETRELLTIAVDLNLPDETINFLLRKNKIGGSAFSNGTFEFIFDCVCKNVPVSVFESLFKYDSRGNLIETEKTVMILQTLTVVACRKNIVEYIINLANGNESESKKVFTLLMMLSSGNTFEEAKNNLLKIY